MLNICPKEFDETEAAWAGVGEGRPARPWGGDCRSAAPGKTRGHPGGQALLTAKKLGGSDREIGQRQHLFRWETLGRGAAWLLGGGAELTPRLPRPDQPPRGHPSPVPLRPLHVMITPPC